MWFLTLTRKPSPDSRRAMPLAGLAKRNLPKLRRRPGTLLILTWYVGVVTVPVYPFSPNGPPLNANSTVASALDPSVCLKVSFAAPVNCRRRSPGYFWPSSVENLAVSATKGSRLAPIVGDSVQPVFEAASRSEDSGTSETYAAASAGVAFSSKKLTEKVTAGCSLLMLAYHVLKLSSGSAFSPASHCAAKLLGLWNGRLITTLQVAGGPATQSPSFTPLRASNAVRCASRS